MAKRSNAVHRELIAYLNECAAQGKEPVTDTQSIYQLMEKRVAADFTALAPRHAYAAQAWFQTKVLRELNLLAKTGLLIKTGDRRHLEFLTPTTAARRDEQEQERLRQEAAFRQQVAGLKLRLQALGVEPGPSAGAPIKLDAADWEILVGLAEKARREL